MAAKATICKADLEIADIDRHYYENHSLTIARHPSETDERMMMRLLAFVLYADASLAFGRGLSTDDEPDLWRKDLTGAVELWIEVGQPQERDLRRACGRSRRVVVVTYSGRSAELWWEQNRQDLQRLKNLTVINVPAAQSQALTALAQRNMRLQCNIQERQVWISDASAAISLEPQIWLAPSDA